MAAIVFKQREYVDTVRISSNKEIVEISLQLFWNRSASRYVNDYLQTKRICRYMVRSFLNKEISHAEIYGYSIIMHD